MTIAAGNATTLAFAVLLAGMPAAWADTTGRDVIGATFASADTSGNGSLDEREIAIISNNIFEGMDYNEDNRVSQEEFFAWDFGIGQTSVAGGKQEAYDTARRIMFSLRDRSQNKFISKAEWERDSKASFDYADMNDNRSLSETEYATRFGPALIFRAALAPRDE